MRRKTYRYIAWLCVFCMLMTGMPFSVMSDSVPATPTDLQPAAREETGNPEPAEPGIPEARPADPESGWTDCMESGNGNCREILDS